MFNQLGSNSSFNQTNTNNSLVQNASGDTTSINSSPYSVCIQDLDSPPLSLILDPSKTYNTIYSGSIPYSYTSMTILANISWYDTTNSISAFPLVQPSISCIINNAPFTIFPISTFNCDFSNPSSSIVPKYMYQQSATFTYNIASLGGNTFKLLLSPALYQPTGGTRTTTVLINSLDILYNQ